MSACLATADAARGLTVGVHGTTFGGNPLAMAVGNATLDVILAPGFLERVARLGLDMRQRLAELKDRHHAVIEEIRGEGLLIGLKLKVPPASFAEAALDLKLLVIPAGDNVVRVLPPLDRRRRGDRGRRPAARRHLRRHRRAIGRGDELNA